MKEALVVKNINEAPKVNQVEQLEKLLKTDKKKQHNLPEPRRPESFLTYMTTFHPTEGTKA